MKPGKPAIPSSNPSAPRKPRRFFTPAEDAAIKSSVASVSELARQFGRTRQAVCRRRKLLRDKKERGMSCDVCKNAPAALPEGHKYIRMGSPGLGGVHYVHSSKCPCGESTNEVIALREDCAACAEKASDPVGWDLVYDGPRSVDIQFNHPDGRVETRELTPGDRFQIVTDDSGKTAVCVDVIGD